MSPGPGSRGDRWSSRGEPAVLVLAGDGVDDHAVSVRRVVPDLACRSVAETTEFYRSVLGLQPVMDHGWIVTLAHPDRPGAQLSLLTHDETAPVVPDVSIQVDDVDTAYAEALGAKAEIVHPLTDEPWGVRRFFVRDPDGHVVNVLSHPEAATGNEGDR